MISVLIPVLNEAENLSVVLENLVPDRQHIEIIVIDGGSKDKSRDIARQKGAKVITSPPGRGLQLREGAKIASGEILWFLHADCRVAPGSVDAIWKGLAQHPEVPGGNFKLHFDGEDSFSQWLNGFYARIRKRGIYYGDSGVYVRRTAYDRLGGFRPLSLMEDYDFNRKLERSGRTLCIDAPPLVTSARRFQGRHKWAIIWQWVMIHLLFHLKVPSPVLAWLYNSARRR